MARSGNEELQKETGLSSASFCHKGGFLMTTATLEDARKACQISLDTFTDEITLVNLSSDTSTDTLLMKLPELTHVKIIHKPLPDLPALDINGIYAENRNEKKQSGKKYIKDLVKRSAENENRKLSMSMEICFLFTRSCISFAKSISRFLLLLQKTVKNLLSVSHPVPDFLLSGI